MIPVGICLWHLVVALLLGVIWRLSVRLGKAMRDDVGAVMLFPVASVGIGVAGLAWLASYWIYGIGLYACGLDLLSGVLGWYAAWRSWNWLLQELKGTSTGG